MAHTWLTRLISSPPEQVRIDLMPWVWLVGVGTPVDGLQAYQLHQPADPLAVDLVSVISEPGSHPSGSVERCLQVLLVYEGHQLQVLNFAITSKRPSVSWQSQ